RLWNSIRAHAADHWNVGRGRKSKQQPKDVLFMFLVVLKHCGKWDVVANVLRIKTGTFQKMILSFAEVVSPYLYEKYVVSAAGKFTMEALVLGDNTFHNYPSARYAPDVTFQQSNMPTGQTSSSRLQSRADEGPLTTEHPDSWAVLADKGYQGLAADFRAITPFKKQPLRELTLEQMETNDRIAHDRVLVENYFGRLCTLWAMCSDKYRWDEGNYDMFF
ncbi:hypothetical protein L916_01859, partial [Phytophthora nicotianae]